MSKEQGNLIIINGASSVGKTTTCRALQDLFSDLHVLLGIDVFSQIVPPKQNNMRTIDPEYFTATPYVKDGVNYFHIETGPLLDSVIYTSYKAIADYLHAGINVISDQLFWSPKWFREMLNTLHGFKVFYVGLFSSEIEGRRREQLRSAADVHDIVEGGRLEGWNRTSAELTHANMLYDFKIDNTQLSTIETAKKIKQAYEQIKIPTAFTKLYQTYK